MAIPMDQLRKKPQRKFPQSLQVKVVKSSQRSFGAVKWSELG
jgi:hypothetical protein